MPYSQVSTYDILSHKRVFIMKSAVKGIEETFEK